MFSVFRKELQSFFSSLIGYVVVGVFLIVMWLIMWFFTDTSLLNQNLATMGQLFHLGPLIFVFLIPALTMRSFSEERQKGTIEFLSTKPLTDLQITMGKYLACLILVLFAIIPTVIYYYTIYNLGLTAGNLDSGAIVGSYFGLFLLGAVFVAIGVFASSLVKDQVVAFVLATFLCFLFHWGFFFISELPFFFGKSDLFIQRLGIDFHYSSISRGVIDIRDLVYFFSVIVLFIASTVTSLGSRRW